MRALRLAVLAAALVAVLMLAASGPATRLGLWEWRTGLTMMGWALYVGLGAVPLLVLAGAVVLVRRRRVAGAAPSGRGTS